MAWLGVGIPLVGLLIEAIAVLCALVLPFVALGLGVGRAADLVRDAAEKGSGGGRLSVASFLLLLFSFAVALPVVMLPELLDAEGYSIALLLWPMTASLIWAGALFLLDPGGNR